jgi:predicted nuclease of predicted toxin-antitoxin system
MSPGAVEELRALGHDVSWVGEWLRDPGDDAILARAGAEGRVLVTLDNDFGTLAVLHRRRHAGIIRIIEQSVWTHAALCERALREHAAGLVAGGIVTVENERTRLRSHDRA